jgi:hypothetical protein
MIHIKKNKKIKLNIPSFSCDSNAVGEHLNSHPLLKLLNVYGFLALIGRPGSGKTSFSIAMMTQKENKIYRKTHHHLIVVMAENSIGSLNKNPFKGLDYIYNELNEKSINEIHGLLDGFSKEGEKTILFIDDCTADLKRSKIVIDTLKRIVFNRRHLKCNIIITAQTYPSIPLDLRKCITNLVLFRPPKKEVERVFEEMIESKKDIFEKIMQITYDEPHNFLFVNVPSQRMFKNWDEILINDD